MLGQLTKAYITLETKDTVTLTFCEDEDGTTRSISFPKPFLDVHDGLPRQIVGYICNPIIVDGYTMVQINPACLYLSPKTQTILSWLLQKSVTSVKVKLSKVEARKFIFKFKPIQRAHQHLHCHSLWATLVAYFSSYYFLFSLLLPTHF